MTTDELLQELSLLSRETSHASFGLQHLKENGYWKVVFNNAMAARSFLKEKPTVQEALQEAIDWLKQNRRPVEIPVEKYTLLR